LEEGFFGPEQSKPVRKWLIWTLVLIVAIFIVFLTVVSLRQNRVKADSVGMIVNVPNENNVADWQIYNNQKYNYSLKYMNNWFVLDSDPAKVYIQPQNDQNVHIAALTIEVKDGFGTGSIDDVVKAFYPNTQYQKTEIMIGSDKAYKIKTSCASSDCGLEERFILKDGKVYHLKQNINLKTDKFNAMLGTFKINPVVVASVLPVKQKTFINKELGFEFTYPGSWQDIVLTPIEKNAINKGSAFSSLYRSDSSQPVFFDPDNVFGFNIYSADFANGVLALPVGQKVNLAWAKEDFLANMKPKDWVTGYEKLGNNALLVVTHADHACYPDFEINIYVPTNNAIYPNLIINLETSEIDRDQSILDYLHFQASVNQDVCSTREPYQEISDKIIKGTYSGKIKAELDTAQKIADSFKSSVVKK